MPVKKQYLETCMEQCIGSGLRKEYQSGVCYHPVCLTYMLSTSSEILGWMSDRLKSRYMGEKSTTSDIQMIYDTSLMAKSEEELKNHLMRVKEESEKADLKINIKKNNNKKLRSCVWSHHFMANR